MLLVPDHELERYNHQPMFDAQQIKQIQFFEKIISFGEPSAPFNCAAGQVVEDDNTIPLIYNPIREFLGKSNYLQFLYNITMCETIQYYILDTDNEIALHRDINLFGHRKEDRRITVLTILSEKNEYTGGELSVDINGTGEHQSIEAAAGDMLCFDSHVSWKINPVQSGQLKLLFTCGWGPLQI